MKKKNDKFTVQYPTARTICAVVRSSNVSKDIWKKILTLSTEASNELTRLLLTLRGNKYAINLPDAKKTIDVSEEKAIESLLLLKKEHSIAMSDEDFIAASRHIYRQFIDGGKNGRAMANLFFNEDEDIALGCLEFGSKKSASNDSENDSSTTEDSEDKVVSNAKLLAGSTLFPIKSAKGLNAESHVLKYGVTKSAFGKLLSMEEIQKNYDEEKALWSQKCASCNLEHIDEYLEFVLALQSHPDYQRFDSQNFKDFVNNWRGRKVYKNDEKTEFTRKPGMYSEFISLPKDHVFQAQDKYKYGYSAELMNMLFAQFRNLWDVPQNNKEREWHGIIGDNRYISLVLDFYHWRKESVAVSLYGRRNKKVGLQLGKNFVKFEVEQDCGITKLILGTKSFDSIKAESEVCLSHSGYRMEIEPLYSPKKAKAELTQEEKDAATNEKKEALEAKAKGETYFAEYKKQKKAKAELAKTFAKKEAKKLAEAEKAEQKKEDAEAKAQGKTFYAAYKERKKAEKRQAAAERALERNTEEKTKIRSDIPDSDFSSWELSETYRIRYSRDSKNKTWYVGDVKEPALRFNPKNERIYVDIPISGHKVASAEYPQGVPYDAECFNFGVTMRTSYPIDGRAAEVSNGEERSFRAMGVDFGVENPFVATIADVRGGEIEKIIAVEKSVKSKSCEENKKKYRSLCETIESASVLLGMTKAYVTEKIDTIKTVTTKKGTPIHVASTLGINMEEYLAFLAPYRARSDKDEALRELKLKKSGWVIGEILHRLKDEISKIKQAYESVPKGMKQKYCEEEGQVDSSLFYKRQLIKRYMHFANSFSFIGFAPKEAERIRETFANKNQAYYRGLTRQYHMTLASDIISSARKHNVKAIYVEDLDVRVTLDQSEEENSFQAEMGIGAFQKALADNASKHQISVFAVNPEFTSQIDPVSGTFGYNEGRNLYVKRNGSIVPVSLDRDEAASQNILARGISRQSDLRNFTVECLNATPGAETYRLNMPETKEEDDGVSSEKGKKVAGKCRRASLYRAIGSTECLFRRNSNGGFDIVSRELTAAERSQAPIVIRKENGNPKRIEMQRDGNGSSARWMLREELKAEIEANIQREIIGREPIREPQAVNV